MQDETNTATWSLPLEAEGELELSSDMIPVRLRPAGPDGAARISSDGRDLEASGLAIEQLGRRVRVRVSVMDAFPFGFWGSNARGIDVYLPPAVRARVRTDVARIEAERLGGCELELETSAGIIAVRELSGRIVCASDAGAIEAHDLGPCEVELRAEAGRITLENVQGRIRLVTRAGSITGVSLAGSVDCSAELGTISLQLADLDAGEHRVQTKAGSIRIELPPELRVRVETSATIGRARSEHPSDPAAAAVLRATTELGDVRIQTAAVRRPTATRTPAATATPRSQPLRPATIERDEQPPHTETAPAPRGKAPEPREEQVARILQMVERGELSASDAEDLLRAIDRE